MEPLKEGDVILTASTGRLGRLIRWATRSRGEPKTKVNHAEQCVVGGSMYSAIVVGALAKVRRRTLWEGYGRGRIKVAVFRPIFAQPNEISDVVQIAENSVGSLYGPLKLPLHFADFGIGRLLFWRKNKEDPLIFRRFARIKRMPICSGNVAHGWYKGAGVRLGGPWWAVSPDTIWDHFKMNSNRWCMVWDLTCLRDIAQGKVA